MSFIPDCRNDDYYNEDFLTASDKAEVAGFDWCCEMAADNFFDNMDIFFDEDSHMRHMLDEELPEDMKEQYDVESSFGEHHVETREVKTYGDLLRSKMLDYIESVRDEMITSMIDNMPDEIFKAVRNKVLQDNAKSENPKQYYDTRKYAVTGVKKGDGPDETED